MAKSENILTDSWGRQMDYLRIAVTDRCNLRCFYCMSEEHIKFLPKKNLLTYEEIIRLVSIYSSLGVKKVRITGGEPFMRKDLLPFLTDLRSVDGIEKLHITTNGVLTHPHVETLKSIGIDGVNLSLDSLDKENFFKITRRDEFDIVMKCLDELISAEIPTKINMVLMDGVNSQEIIPMAKLAEDKNIHVRFIEEMPFNGSDKSVESRIDYKTIYTELENYFGSLTENNNSTSDPASIYSISGFKGKIGIIPAYSRTFCGSCNRIRLTALGTIKNCLYDEGVLDLKEMIRSGSSDQEIKEILLKTAKKKEKDGHITEAMRHSNKVITESMSTIGG